MSISWSKDRWRSYICISNGAQTHIIALAKGEPRARLINPFLCRKKNILETMKSFSISDLNNYLITSLPVNYYILTHIVMYIHIFKWERIASFLNCLYTWKELRPASASLFVGVVCPGKPFILFNSAQANQAIRQTKEIREKSSPGGLMHQGAALILILSFFFARYR